MGPAVNDPGEATAWMDHSECLGMDGDLFFPPRSQPRHLVQMALEACDRCQVRAECFQFVMAMRPPHGLSEVPGIWGGTTASERRQIRARQAATRMDLPQRRGLHGPG